MRPSNVTARSSKFLAMGVLAGLAVASCSGGSGSSQTAGSTTATTARTTAGTGRSTATLTVGGDKVLAGALTSTSISCSFPSLDGATITVLSRTVDADVGIFIVVAHSRVSLRVASGSGATYLQRQFNGAGVSGFDAARGAHLDAALHEIGVAAGKAKRLPAATSIKGAIDCAGQRPGSATITISGDTGQGALSGTLSSVRVTCAAGPLGKVVTAVGIVKLGAQHALVFVDGQPNAFMLVVEPGGSTTLVFTTTGARAASTTSRGMHVSGDAVERVAGQKPYTVHVAGDAICGAPGGN